MLEGQPDEAAAFGFKSLTGLPFGPRKNKSPESRRNWDDGGCFRFVHPGRYIVDNLHLLTG